MAEGAYLQLPGTPFLRIAADGTTTPLGSTCATFTAADADPAGIMLAVSPAESAVREVDPVSGQCLLRFPTPVPMKAIAVAPDGTVYTIAAAQQFGQEVLYTFESNGKLLIQQGLSFSGSGSGVPGLRVLEGIDFYNGKLYASDHGRVYTQDPKLLDNQGRLSEIDPAKGSGRLYFASPGLETTGDIDIDAAGNLRTVSGGKLLIYRMSDLFSFPRTPTLVTSTLQLDRSTGTGGALAQR